MSFSGTYDGKTVLVTGNTGFKGSWLCEWLLKMNARVTGFALPPATSPNLYEALGLEGRIERQIYADIRELDAVKQAVDEVRPDVVFHLAAQPLVREAFIEPYLTMQTNAVGSLNLLEALRQASFPCVAVMVTTDKVYENTEWLHAYRENDPLGGHDPYSASKSCAEMMISSYQRSFFRVQENEFAPVSVTSARGGNVIGGGDWSKDRIVPDCVRHLSRGEPILVRNRHATRPWQHVLELLSGYLHLGAELLKSRAEADCKRLAHLCSPFNFGPELTSNRPVGDLVEEILKNWPGQWDDHTDPHAPHEAGLLNLTTEKAYHSLEWRPRWRFEETIQRTIDWYRNYYEHGVNQPEQVHQFTLQQISDYAQRRPYLVHA